MPMDFAKLIGPAWVFKADSIGEWDVYPYSVKAASQVEKFATSDKTDTIEFVRSLIATLCKSHISASSESTTEKPSSAELGVFTFDDIQRFSREFLANNSHLIDDSDAKLIKVDDETDAAFLLRVLNSENMKQSAKMRDIFAETNVSLKGLLGSSNSGIRSVSQDLLEQSNALERNFGNSPTNAFNIIHKPYEPLKIPRNPVLESNQHLENMNERLDNLIGFGEKALAIMNGLQVASAVFLEDFSREAKNNSSAARKAIWVGGLAVFLSILQIAYTEFWRVPKDSVEVNFAISQVRSEIDELQVALSAGLERSVNVQDTTAVDLIEAISQTGEIDTDLLKRIEQLLREQTVRDQAILIALKKLSED